MVTDAVDIREWVDPKRTAVVVIDVQNDFCHPEGSMAKVGEDVSMAEQMVPRLIAFIDEARRMKVPIIYTQVIHNPWTDSPARRKRLQSRRIDLTNHCWQGSWGADFYKVVPRQDEPIVAKHRYDAFHNTDLDLILRSMGAQTLIMTGVATNVCVETTSREAYCRDYSVVFLEDCTATYDREDHQATLVNIKKSFGVVTTSKEIIKTWQGGN